MATISRVTTWSDSQILSATALNGEFNNILNDYNGGITNANISAAAAIAYSKLSLTGNIVNADINTSAGITESKITFSGSGHGHTGGTDGKLIAVNRGFGFFAAGTQAVANDVSWNPMADKAMTAIRLDAYAKTAPSGASLTVRIFNVTKSQAIASVSITAGTQSATTASMTNATIAQDDVLRMDITGVGSGTAGADISAVLGATQP